MLSKVRTIGVSANALIQTRRLIQLRGNRVDPQLGRWQCKLVRVCSCSDAAQPGVFMSVCAFVGMLFSGLNDVCRQGDRTESGQRL